MLVPGFDQCVYSGKEVAIVSISTNDIPRRSLESIQDSFLDMFVKLKDSGCKVLITGLLPRRGNPSMLSKMWLVNRWLSSACVRFGFEFVDFWLLFDGQSSWYTTSRMVCI